MWAMELLKVNFLFLSLSDIVWTIEVWQNKRGMIN